MVETRGQLAEETILEIEEAFDIQSLDLSPEEGFYFLALWDLSKR